MQAYTNKQNQCKISILMPACNVEKYLGEALESAVSQTMQEIEIVCIDDGSTDSSGQILDEYAAKDYRVRVIHKVNTGYGNSMNVGLDTASGEYIAILETDDFLEPDACEKLYAVASRTRADMVKANYFTYVTSPEPLSTYFEILKPYGLYNRIFMPLEHPDIFRVRPSIWSGIYRREWLMEQNIRFNETPGASFQDISFAYQVWALAGRAVLVPEAYLHYRTDNTASSVKNPKKVYCVCDEYDFIRDFLEKHPQQKEKLERLTVALKYENYRWNLERLSDELQGEFRFRMKEDFTKDQAEGRLDWHVFSQKAWQGVKEVLGS